MRSADAMDEHQGNFALEHLSGFTMIELIVVITLIGILGVYAQSRFSSVPFDERFFADDMISALRFAQKTALSSGCAVRFNVTGTGYELLRESVAECNDASVDLTGFSATVKRPWQGGDYTNIQAIPASITTPIPVTTSSVGTTPANAVVFYPQGWACNDDGDVIDEVVITLTGTSATRVIRVVCSTGFVYQT